MRFQSGISVAVLSFFFLACGGAEDSADSGEGGIITIDSDGVPKRLVFAPLEPQFMAFNRNIQNPSVLDRVFRILGLNEFDTVVAPSFTRDGRYIAQVVTGIGINAVDDAGAAIPVKLGIVARKYNSQTGSFSRETRIFSAPRTTFEDVQRDFVIMNDNNSNIVLTGLSLRAARARVQTLELQRKSLSKLYEDGAELRAKTFVILENGWVAIGFFLGFPNENVARQAYISDALLHTAEFRAE